MKPFFKNKNPYLFIRFGSLNIKKQKHYTEEDKTFHNPPVRYGFYAMPFILQEWFLIGNITETQKEIFCKEPDYDDEIAWELYEKRVKEIRSKIRRVFEKKEGFVWHHLIESEGVLESSGSWVKTSLKDWCKALRKSIIEDRDVSMDLLKCKSNELRSIIGIRSRDKYEVFFDSKI
jgi:hypothetical protein